MSHSRSLLILAAVQAVFCIGLLVVGFHPTGVILGLAWAVSMHRDAIIQEQREHVAYILDVMSPERS